jgi:phosphoribosyl 1,2-cyclic phosphate phosphodiesterase
MSSLRITVLGSGTSSGIPTIGCSCEVCGSADPRDRRSRPSVLLQFDDRNVIVDTGPDFREQVLRANVRHLDAVLYTHAHADHILGLDDVRPFNFFQKSTIPLYATEETFSIIRRVFAYAFSDEDSQSSRPKLQLNVLDGQPFDLFGRLIIPIRLEHGRGTVYGFRIGRAAYLTDHSAIPAESRELLGDLDVLFVDALRRRPHPTHTTVEEAVQVVEDLKPRRAFFTHMSHDLGHAATESELPPHIRLAYDGLEIEVSE